MFPACRIPDPITHDSVAPCGVTGPLPAGPDPQPTMIEALPAAHMMHGVVCTGLTAGGPLHPPPPPVPPIPIIKGSPTVFIKHMPAARWNPSLDVGGCGVFLGNPLLAATRTTLIGDGAGAPQPILMVMVNGQWVMKFGNSIFIYPEAADADFQGKAAESLQRLNQLSPNMQRAFAALDKTPHTISIKKYDGSLGPFNAGCTPNDMNDAMPKGVSSTIAGTTYTGTGKGTSSVVSWDPDIHGHGPPGTTGPEDQQGADVIAAHELIHGVRNAQAVHDPGIITPDGNNIQTSEERNTVGFPQQTYNSPNAADPNNGTVLPATNTNSFTENGVRDDYRANNVNSPVTNEPAPPRPSYYQGGRPF